MSKNAIASNDLPKTKQSGTLKPSNIGQGLYNRPQTAKTSNDDAYSGMGNAFSRCKCPAHKLLAN